MICCSVVLTNPSWLTECFQLFYVCNNWNNSTQKTSNMSFCMTEETVQSAGVWPGLLWSRHDSAVLCGAFKEGFGSWPSVVFLRAFWSGDPCFELLGFVTKALMLSMFRVGIRNHSFGSDRCFSCTLPNGDYGVYVINIISTCWNRSCVQNGRLAWCI